MCNLQQQAQVAISGSDRVGTDDSTSREQMTWAERAETTRIEGHLSLSERVIGV